MALYLGDLEKLLTFKSDESLNKFDVLVLTSCKSDTLVKNFLTNYLTFPNITVPVSETCFTHSNFEYVLDTLKGVVTQKFCKICLCSHTELFMKLTRLKQAEKYTGVLCNKTLLGIPIIYCPSVNACLLNPLKNPSVALATNQINDFLSGKYNELGENIIHEAKYPDNLLDIKQALEELKQYRELTVDIETYSLNHIDSGLASIAFAYNKHCGVSFQVDALPQAKEIRQALKEFFESYKGTLIYHNSMFDAYILTYQLFMKDAEDHDSMYFGLNHLLRSYEDTKLIAYLATNNVSGNDLSLKSLAHEYAGNYGLSNINKVKEIPTKQLLEYNLKDCLATWFVYNKYLNTLFRDNQYNVYNFYKACVYELIVMQLVGLYTYSDKIEDLIKLLKTDMESATNELKATKECQEFTDIIKQEWVDKKNKTLKTKKVTLDDCKEEFNPSSTKQLSRFLFDHLKLPTVDVTEKGQLACDTNVLKKLIDLTDSENIKEILNNLINLSAAKKIESTFVPVLTAYPNYIYGKFNLGSTVSGRLSSSSGLQQLPSTGTKYAKPFKDCVGAPEGYVMVGIDFALVKWRK